MPQEVQPTLKTAGSLDLDGLQLIAQQQEGNFGPLIGLAAVPPFNVLTFEFGTSPDATHRIVLEAIHGAAPSKPGHALQFQAKCLVGGVPTEVAAYRQVP